MISYLVEIHKVELDTTSKDVLAFFDTIVKDKINSDFDPTKELFSLFVDGNAKTDSEFKAFLSEKPIEARREALDFCNEKLSEVFKTNKYLNSTQLGQLVTAGPVIFKEYLMKMPAVVTASIRAIFDDKAIVVAQDKEAGLQDCLNWELECLHYIEHGYDIGWPAPVKHFFPFLDRSLTVLPDVANNFKDHFSSNN